MSYTSKTWLVTGASSGLGAETSLAALKCGDKVVGTARNAAKASNDYPAFSELGGLWVELDVNHTDTEKAVADIVEKYNVDVLVNNAGYAEGGTLEDTSMEDIRAQFETNVFGALKVLKGCIPFFRTRRKGIIVNVSSTAAVAPHCYFSAYAATKFAIEGVSECLTEELQTFGVRVIIIEPGALRTNFFGTLRYTPLSDGYHGTIVAQTVDAFKSATGEGDPARAGQAIVDVVHVSGLGTPLEGNSRVMLGADAVQRTRGKLQSLRDDWSKAETLAASCAIQK